MKYSSVPRWLIMILVAGLAAFLSYYLTYHFVPEASLTSTSNNKIMRGPSIIDASAITIGIFLGIVLRRLGLFQPLGRIHSFICLGLLAMIGGATFFVPADAAVVRTVIFPIMEILVTVWMIVNAA